MRTMCTRIPDILVVVFLFVDVVNMMKNISNNEGKDNTLNNE